MYYRLAMKKILSLVALTSILMLSVANAAMLSIPELLKDASFGYDSINRVFVDSIDTAKITLRSPIIRDIGGEYVIDYKTTYSTYLIEDLVLMSTQELSTVMKAKDTRFGGGKDYVEITLGVSDGLTADETYYLLVTPLDMYDVPGTTSPQICFNLEQQSYAVGDECLNFKKEHQVADPTPTSTPTEHSAAGADMSLANVTHTINGNTITLRWTRLVGSDKVDIFVWDMSAERYIRAVTARMSDERYDYSMKWDGEHIFRFVPLEGAGREIVYNVNAMRTSEKEPDKEPEKKPDPIVPPATGPVENVLVVLILSGVGYVLYKRYLQRH